MKLPEFWLAVCLTVLLFSAVILLVDQQPAPTPAPQFVELTKRESGSVSVRISEIEAVDSSFACWSVTLRSGEKISLDALGALTAKQVVE